MENTEYLKKLVNCVRLLTNARVCLTLESGEFRMEVYLRSGEKAFIRVKTEYLDPTLDPEVVAKEVYGDVLSAIFSEDGRPPFEASTPVVYAKVRYIGYAIESNKAVVDIAGSVLEVPVSVLGVLKGAE